MYISIISIFYCGYLQDYGIKTLEPPQQVLAELPNMTYYVFPLLLSEREMPQFEKEFKFIYKQYLQTFPPRNACEYFKLTNNCYSNEIQRILSTNFVPFPITYIHISAHYFSTPSIHIQTSTCLLVVSCYILCSDFFCCALHCAWLYYNHYSISLLVKKKKIINKNKWIKYVEKIRFTTWLHSRQGD